MANPTLTRFFGGSPISVLMKLLFLSLLVGAFMSLLGLTPHGLISRVINFVRAIIDMGLDSISEVGRWVLYGAVIVVPIWLVLRLLGGAKR